MVAGKGSETARGGVGQLGLEQPWHLPFGARTYGGFSRRKWGERGGQEAGDKGGLYGASQASLL